jgi:hypothetical protein
MTTTQALIATLTIIGTIAIMAGTLRLFIVTLPARKAKRAAIARVRAMHQARLDRIAYMNADCGHTTARAIMAHTDALLGR